MLVGLVQTGVYVRELVLVGLVQTGVYVRVLCWWVWFRLGFM